MTGRILIIDDEKDMLLLLKRIISEESDHDVVTESDPFKGLGRFKESGADLVITDLKMPKMDGIKLLEGVKKIDPNVSVVIMTAYGTIETAVEAIRKGAYDYITKPFRRERIILTVNKVVEWQGILKENLSPFTNRIHEDDLANICVLAAEKAAAGAIYNVSDGKPGTMSRYFKDIAAALDLPQPAQVDMEEAQKVLSPGMLSYLQESRRIDNTKLIKELGVQLKYADFHQGLEACVKALSH